MSDILLDQPEKLESLYLKLYSSNLGVVRLRGEISLSIGRYQSPSIVETLYNRLFWQDFPLEYVATKAELL